MISERLIKKLGIKVQSSFEMHAWVGFPDEESHAEHAALYFETEIEVMQEIIAYLEQADPSEQIVVDTSGSAIYTPESVMQTLGSLTKMVYLAVTPEMIDMMLAKYLQKPVAVLWNGHFQPKAEESRQETFSRCYPNLLSTRDRLYRKYAEQIVGPEVHRSQAIGTEEFLAILKA